MSPSVAVPGGRRLAPGIVLATLALHIFGCSTKEVVESCSSPEDCPPNAWCESQVCVANSPPVAVITAPVSVAANVAVTFDGSASHDPDAPYDSITDYIWGFSPVAASCSPPSPVSDTTPQSQAVFTCSGTFEVSLIVRDELAVSSSQTYLVVEVDP